eukprot:tig00000711_g3380.t1
MYVGPWQEFTLARILQKAAKDAALQQRHAANDTISVASDRPPSVASSNRSSTIVARPVTANPGSLSSVLNVLLPPAISDIYRHRSAPSTLRGPKKRGPRSGKDAAKAHIAKLRENWLGSDGGSTMAASESSRASEAGSSSTYALSPHGEGHGQPGSGALPPLPPAALQHQHIYAHAYPHPPYPQPPPPQHFPSDPRDPPRNLSAVLYGQPPAGAPPLAPAPPPYPYPYPYPAPPHAPPPQHGPAPGAPNAPPAPPAHYPYPYPYPYPPPPYPYPYPAPPPGAKHPHPVSPAPAAPAPQAPYPVAAPAPAPPPAPAVPPWQPLDRSLGVVVEEAEGGRRSPPKTPQRGAPRAGLLAPPAHQRPPGSSGGRSVDGSEMEDEVDRLVSWTRGLDMPDDL